MPQIDEVLRVTDRRATAAGPMRRPRRLDEPADPSRRAEEEEGPRRRE
jgi:hypothetical protein